MDYRTLPKVKGMFSVIGLGFGTIHELPADEMEMVFNYAIEQGINFFDVCVGHIDVFRVFGKSIAGRRDKIYTQMHFGAVYGDDDKYANIRELDAIKKSFERVLRETRTDYTDIGYFHCVDEESHFEHIVNNGVLDYVEGLKKQGVVRYIGFSSHNPTVAIRFLEMDIIDVCMFSLNPAYDYAKGDRFAMGKVDERARFYQMCESKKIGISVMKPFCGGQLLDEKTSPIGISLTKNQCIQYALDRPSVFNCVPGVRNLQDVKDLLTFFDASPDEKNYSVINKATPPDAQGRCVYCNHCQPCPQDINIGLINKYYDLSNAGDELAKDHYHKLSVKASQCTKCGHCDSHCPFHVKQMERMDDINRYFG